VKKETPAAGVGIARGTAVVIVLHAPREKCWGVIDEIDPAGVFLRGLEEMKRPALCPR
jgi:hypothetical protein